MARILVTTIPIAGHVRPALPVAQHLAAARHEVVWYTGRKFERLVTKTGARFVPINAELEFQEADFDVLHDMQDRKPGLSGLKKLILELFIQPVPTYTEDVSPLIDTFMPDVVVADHCFMAAPLLAIKLGIPKVLFAVGPLSVSSADTAPYGMGLQPASSLPGHLRNRLLQWAVQRAVFRDCQQAAENVMTQLGFTPPAGFFMDWGVHLADRYIHASVPAFEYPRSDLPAAVEFVGAMLPVGVDDWQPPAWWPDITQARRARRPVVLVTQGTATTDPELLVKPAIAALAARDMLVIATTSELDPDDVLPAGQRPANVRLEKFIPFTELLPLVDLVITNGGYGGVQMSLAYGIPLVVAGMSEDKMEVNARVTWSGTGISLRTHHPSPAKIGTAASRVLADPRYRAKAQGLKRAYAENPGAPRAAELIAEMATLRHRLAQAAPGMPDRRS